jgi:hypothetical protein
MYFYTPLEQFDEVNWLSHRVIETLEPYVLFISEREFDASQLYINPYGVSSSSISFMNLRQAESLVFIFLLLSVPIISNVVAPFFQGFTPLFFLAAINVFTGFFVMI